MGLAVPVNLALMVTDRVPMSRRACRTHGRLEAVLVSAVEADSAACRNGVRQGNLIFGVNATRVRTVEEPLRALRTAEQPLRLALLRGECRITLLIH